MFSAWDEILKGQPEWLEIPVETALYEKAESAAKAMGCGLEEAVMAFLMKLAEGDAASWGITPDIIASARLMREMEKEKEL